MITDRIGLHSVLSPLLIIHTQKIIIITIIIIIIIIDSLINTVRVFSDDIRMAFGLKKCAVVVMKRGEVVKYDGVDLLDGRRMKSVEKDGLSIWESLSTVKSCMQG